MPKFTNRFGLPQALFKALTWSPDRKRRSDIGVTELSKSPRQRLLEKRHDKDISVDASDMLWLLMGKSIHAVIEQSGKAGHGTKAFMEEYLQVSIHGPLGIWTVGGVLDNLEYDDDGITMVLDDYKVSGVYGFLLEKKNGFCKPEWAAQLNVYHWILSKYYGFKDIKRMRIIGLLRDWKKGDYDKSLKSGAEYPPCPIVVPEVPIWPADRTGEYVHDRVRTHQDAAALADDDLPDCTKEERWERGGSFAVMERGKKRASKLCSTHDEASHFVKSINEQACKDAAYVDTRPTQSTRCCPEYCHGAPWCSYYKSITGEVIHA